VRLEGLDQLKNSITSSGIEPASSIVHQPTALPRVRLLYDEVEKRKFGPKREEVPAEQTKLRNKETLNL
jgi:hypothetical protein